MLSRIRDIDPVRDAAKAEFRCPFFEGDCRDLFAVIAAVSRVLEEFCVTHLGDRDDIQPKPEFAGNLLSLCCCCPG